MPTIVLPNMRQKIYKSIGMTVVSVLLLFGAILMVSFTIAKAVLLGGVMWSILQGFCAVRLFHQIETTPKTFISKFYQTEVAKLLLISVGAIGIFKWSDTSVPGFLMGYIWAQIVFLGSMFK